MFTLNPLNFSETSQTFEEIPLEVNQTGAGARDDPEQGPSSSYWTPLPINNADSDVSMLILG